MVVQVMDSVVVDALAPAHSDSPYLFASFLIPLFQAALSDFCVLVVIAMVNSHGSRRLGFTLHTNSKREEMLR